MMKTNDKMWMYIGQAFDEWFDKTYPGTPTPAFKDNKRREVVIQVRKSSAVLLRALELACEDIEDKR